MKKFTNLLLAAVLSFCLPLSVRAAENSGETPAETAVPESSEEASGLPDEGEEIEGFTVVERGVYIANNAQTVLFEHDKTGAQVYYIASDDIDRAMTISVKTPTMDDKGIPHVFEHATISGSEKYPSPNLFMAMAASTYNTFLNAFTRSNYTTFEASSLSEDQLMTYTDFFLDGVLHPLLLTDERLYRREAWRYELPDADSPITVNGTVYNEMKGTNTIDIVSGANAIDALFPDSIIGSNPGGVPEHIAEMTWDDLRDFHAAYYHPSNMLVTLFGDLDYAAFLKLMDEEYFSEYDKKEIAVETGEIDPLTAAVENVYPFAVEAGASVNNASVFSYGFAANGADVNEQNALDYLMGYFSQESSPLVKNLREALPGANLSTSPNVLFNSSYYPVPFRVFNVTGLNESDKDVFKTVFSESLAQIAEEGVDTELIKAMISTDRLSYFTLSEQMMYGINISTFESAYWATTGSVGLLNDTIEALDYIEARLDDGYMDELLAKYFINNKHNALAITVPEPGAAEENAAALEEKLSEMKDGMTEDEIDEMVKEAAELVEWSLEEPTAEDMAKVRAVRADSLPEEVREYDIVEKEEDGVRYLTTEVNVTGIGRTVLSLNTSGVPLEDQHYLKLISALFGSLPTEEHTVEEVNLLITQYLNSPSINAGWEETFDSKEVVPILSAAWTSSGDNYKAAAELVGELLYDVDYSDSEAVKTVVNRLKTQARNSFTGSGTLNVQFMRAAATVSDAYAYASYIGGIEYYQFLIDAAKALEEDPETFCKKLAEVSDKITVRDGVSIRYAGDAEGIKLFNENVSAVLDGLAEGTITPADFIPERYDHDSEAIIINSAVQSNVIAASMEEIGLENDGKALPLQLLVADKYMIPVIRNDIGAYFGGLQILPDSDGILLMLTMNDPSIAETFGAYENMSGFFKELAITQDEIDNYIISAFSGLAAPEGELTGAINAMNRKLYGYPDDYYVNRMKEVKAFTVADVKAAADALAKAADVGFRSTAGGALMINEYADMYEEFIDINAMDPDAASAGLTFGEISSLLLGGQENAYETLEALGAFALEGLEDASADGVVNREQFALLIAATIPLDEAENETEPADMTEVSEWAADAVNLVLANGMMSLDGEDNFNPDGVVLSVDFDALMTRVTEMAAEDGAVEDSAGDDTADAEE